MSDLTDRLLAKTTAPAVDPAPREAQLTSELEVSGDEASGVVRSGAVADPEQGARDLLERAGLVPDQWVVTSYRTSEWTRASGDPGVSTKYTFARRGTRAAEAAVSAALAAGGVPLDDLLGTIRRARPRAARGAGDHAYVVALGDTQFGKIDGDGVEGALERCVRYLDHSRDLLETHRKRFDVGHVHIAWLGDHIEGFVSQSGANTWRTPLTLSEQIRLVRRVMLHAVDLFAGAADRVSMAAVPGNHGETIRFAGKGVTRYDDSHDTESLIAVADACKLNPKAFGHVEFYVPETDEMTVTLDLAGTVTSHAHGHQWRPGRHFTWWEGQAFGGSPLRDAQLLLAGHLHHAMIEESGRRLFVQVPALEAESTWWRHAKGIPGNPGILTMITKDGHTSPMEVVR